MTKTVSTKDITKHVLVPQHSKLSEKEKQELFKKLNITQRVLPKISKDDPALRSLEVKQGDIIKITRQSPTAKEAIFYRGVVDD